TVLLPRYCQPENISMKLLYDSASPLEAPLAEGERVGTVTAMYDGIPLVTGELVTLTKVEREDEIVPGPGGDIGGSLLSELLRYWYLTVPLLLMFILLIALLIIRAVNVHKAKKLAKLKRQRAAQRRRTDG
ncbi:MAG: hypothetical protein CW335_08235, partial [Clostridiales bacterium]|nr:hypothetical protein [Clostridiales bacterium]